ncbi:Conserved hypothetical protein [Capnocytophaga canimorsus Cc5]|uniref:PoNi C-terminal domain-containing protein n=3 Tax=Capnocytophaga canimorsus TaxID=28188 RepID=F9YS66_CAPCC|nr:PoNi-like cognate immunity protein [Capnocytophaga canimorsus]AEK22619.1 Conserved hypothetical protein [Capnocytophaga canimorsus Cc5]WGU69367.1 DUF1911 domain-containing protein [Capnocytophaga canimorsus]WGU71511.1 DUF1911 domain-containing protein [Capnocytophaga canimorsus]
MKIRDNFNRIEKYQEIITKKQNYIFEDKQEIADLLTDEANGIQKYPKPNLEVIKSTKNRIINYYLDVIFAKYSAGYDISEIKTDFLHLLTITDELWQEKSLTEFTYQKSEPYYGTDEYELVLNLISLGILLNCNDKEFEKIIKIRDKIPTKDILLDFFLSFKDKRNIHKEQSKSNTYKGLNELILKNDVSSLIKDLKTYLSKSWYKERSYAGWHNSHKSKHNIYTGYWSFESGALVKIIGLDDSLLKDQKYYPYDMVHWQ